jgi:heterodisulfide reductase subunit B
MTYAYYPGCSLEGTAKEYDISTRAFLERMRINLVEIENWTCCGATAAEATSHLLALGLPARNLALAEQMGVSQDILVPCSACYLNLQKATQTLQQPSALQAAVDHLLAEEGLHFQGELRVRHLLDVLAHDVGARRIGQALQKPLTGAVIAPYYGCQCLRPFPVFDDPERPRSMEPLIKAIGAKIHPWHMGAKCCGASHMNTKPEVGLTLVASILKAAQGADAIVTVCPMCQMNLEGFQSQVSQLTNMNLEIAVLYLPQLLGLALGLTPDALGMGYNLALTDVFRTQLNRLQAA